MERQSSIGYNGLTSQQVLVSRSKYGENIYAGKKRKSIFRRFLENLNDPIIRILLAAMAVNILFTIKNINWAETAGIIIAIMISTVVSTFSEYGSEKAFEKMRAENDNQKVNVIRDGITVRILSRELVVGDCVRLYAGERVPADGRLISGTVKSDQSAINGESKPVLKKTGTGQSKKSPESIEWIFAGSMIMEGEGLLLVTDVGDRSLYGEIAREIQHEGVESPLKQKLSKLASSISKIGYFAAGLVAVTYLFGVFVVDCNFESAAILARLTNLRFLAMSIMKAITIAMTVIVVAVPEGLPMMITVVLSSNMKKMLKDQVLVRKLVGIETAGSMNILFTDKTGTLTEGKLQCSELILGTGERYGRERDLDKLKALIGPSIYINSSCVRSKNGYVGGNATEQALCTFVKKHESYPVADEKIPFNSKIKFSAASVRMGTYQGVYFKGAPEKILPYCTLCYDENGKRISFDKERMKKLIQRLSGGSCRIIAFATGERLSEPERAGALTFLCIAVLKDSLRKEAFGAVKELREAGIQTVMITGDSKETAHAVAKECGILSHQQNLVLQGAELEKMSDKEISAALPCLAVVSRALPKDKSRLVRIAQSKGMIAGMTGDGVNDAPALKKADVGFAMGSGTEIAKEAGDIVILDGNLSSIVNAVLYGRTIFKSIRKFITFQLTMNLCAVGVSLFGQILGIENPITVIQMLWVNIIMDTLGGLAFAGEYPLRMYLKEKPIGREEPILSKQMIAQTVIMGGFGTLLCSAFLSSSTVRTLFLFETDPMHLYTAFFALFIFTGIAICFTTRSERINLAAGLSKNKLFIVIMAAIVLVQLVMLYFGGETFRCCGLSLRGLLLVNACSLVVIPVDLLRRLAVKRLSKQTVD